MKRIILDVDEELHRELKVAVVKKGLTIRAVVTALIIRWLEEQRAIQRENER